MEIVKGSGIPSSKEELVKELARWEQHHTEFTPRGTKPGNPYTKREFPMMVYRAQQHPQSGKWCTAMVAPSYLGYRSPDEWNIACQAAAEFTKACQKIVRDERELTAAMESGEGWRPTQKEAMAWRQALEDQVERAAAERNYADKNMGERARAEAAAFEAENFGHQPVIPDAAERKHRKEAKRERGAA
jgi:hypothetical protein